MSKQKIKWGSVIPLIGGHSIGSYIATETKPQFLISYPGFLSNDQHIRNYWPDVPYLLVDPHSNQFLSQEEVLEIKNIENYTLPDNDKIDQIDFTGVDFINSTCPCAGLSMMNSSNKKDSAGARGSDAKQNEWMYKSTRFILDNVKPRVLFGENAPGLYTKTGKGVVENLKKIAEEYNYSFSVYKTNTIYHGIPQKRERTFYFLWDSPTVPIFDNYRREHKTLTEYLSEIPKDASLQDIFAGAASVEKNPYIMFLKYKEGANWRQEILKFKTVTTWLVYKKLLNEMIEWLEQNYNFEGANEVTKEKTIKFLKHVQTKLDDNKGWWDGTPHFFGDTINAVIGRTIENTIHPTKERGLSLRECMHLMGLPHDFTIPGKNYYNHIAQNVPTCTARDMTAEVIKFIKGQAKMSEVNFLKQSNSTGKIESPLKSAQLF
jgi:site-specific DNA-cytosine methylase